MTNTHIQILTYNTNTHIQTQQNNQINTEHFILLVGYTCQISLLLLKHYQDLCKNQERMDQVVQPKDNDKHNYQDLSDSLVIND